MISVTVVFSPAPRVVAEQVVCLADTATPANALNRTDLPERFPDVDWPNLAVGIWGRVVAWDAALVDGDRVEICRPLTVDPKVARRERFARQGARGTGLFANRRKGGKAGY